jgi:hypothetical protein
MTTIKEVIYGRISEITRIQKSHYSDEREAALRHWIELALSVDCVEYERNHTTRAYGPTDDGAEGCR